MACAAVIAADWDGEVPSSATPHLSPGDSFTGRIVYDLSLPDEDTRTPIRRSRDTLWRWLSPPRRSGATEKFSALGFDIRQDVVDDILSFETVFEDAQDASFFPELGIGASVVISLRFAEFITDTIAESAIGYLEGDLRIFNPGGAEFLSVSISSQNSHVVSEPDTIWFFLGIACLLMGYLRSTKATRRRRSE